MRELTQNELSNVRGAWGVPGAGLGAFAGAAGYLGFAATSGTFSWGQLGVYTAGGALTGAIGGPVGVVRAYFMPRAAFGVGAVASGISTGGPTPNELKDS